MATKTVVRYRARPKKKSRRRGGFTLSLAAAAGFLPLVSAGIRELKVSPETAANGLAYRLTGYDPGTRTWSWGGLKQGMLPIALGLLVHKMASRLGVNRMLGRAKIPFLRV